MGRHVRFGIMRAMKTSSAIALAIAFACLARPGLADTPLPPGVQHVVDQRFPGWAVESSTSGALHAPQAHDLALVLVRPGDPQTHAVAVLLDDARGGWRFSKSSSAIDVGARGQALAAEIRARVLVVRATEPGQSVARVTSYRFADGLICPSPTVRDDIIAWCGLDQSSVALVPNPMPAFSGDLAPPPHPWLEPGGPPVFVQTSNMTYWKRLDLLVDAFAEVRRQRPARLLIVGEGPGRADAEDRIRRRGLDADVETVGWVDDPLQYAARAWAFVLPSDEEGFAQVLTEAMSVDCPVITTDARGGGPRFVTKGGRDGVRHPLQRHAAHVQRGSGDAHCGLRGR